jgi:hypothetical protein
MKSKSMEPMINFIWLWLLLLRDWFYMKPFCFDSSVDQDKKRYTSVGINLPRGWKFIHIYLTTEGSGFSLRITRTRTQR